MNQINVPTQWPNENIKQIIIDFQHGGKNGLTIKITERATQLLLENFLGVYLYSIIEISPLDACGLPTVLENQHLGRIA